MPCYFSSKFHNRLFLFYEDNSRDGNVFLEVGFDLAANSFVTFDVQNVSESSPGWMNHS